MKFMDAGKKMETGLLPEAPSGKVYPRFTVDLDKFPKLKADVDESVELHLKGRVCGVTHTDYCNSMDVEVQSIAAPNHTHDSENAADKEYERLRGK